ncbi:MAG: hypothetical protein KAR32_08445, partial [Candidatus Omnitrophica bacterium]|nr:hypothetical protein [Candidatus Omnitrophota bacterium]
NIERNWGEPVVSILGAILADCGLVNGGKDVGLRSGPLAHYVFKGDDGSLVSVASDGTDYKLPAKVLEEAGEAFGDRTVIGKTGVQAGGVIVLTADAMVSNAVLEGMILDLIDAVAASEDGLNENLSLIFFANDKPVNGLGKNYKEMFERIIQFNEEDSLEGEALAREKAKDAKNALVRLEREEADREAAIERLEREKDLKDLREAQAEARYAAAVMGIRNQRESTDPKKVELGREKMGKELNKVEPENDQMLGFATNVLMAGLGLSEWSQVDVPAGGNPADRAINLALQRVLTPEAFAKIADANPVGLAAYGINTLTDLVDYIRDNRRHAVEAGKGYIEVNGNILELLIDMNDRAVFGEIPVYKKNAIVSQDDIGDVAFGVLAENGWIEPVKGSAEEGRLTKNVDEIKGALLEALGPKGFEDTFRALQQAQRKSSFNDEYNRIYSPLAKFIENAPKEVVRSVFMLFADSDTKRQNEIRKDYEKMSATWSPGIIQEAFFYWAFCVNSDPNFQFHLTRLEDNPETVDIDESDHLIGYVIDQTEARKNSQHAIRIYFGVPIFMDEFKEWREYPHNQALMMEPGTDYTIPGRAELLKSGPIHEVLSGNDAEGEIIAGLVLDGQVIYKFRKGESLPPLVKEEGTMVDGLNTYFGRVAKSDKYSGVDFGDNDFATIIFSQPVVEEGYRSNVDRGVGVDSPTGEDANWHVNVYKNGRLDEIIRITDRNNIEMGEIKTPIDEKTEVLLPVKFKYFDLARGISGDYAEITLDDGFEIVTEVNGRAVDEDGDVAILIDVRGPVTSAKAISPIGGTRMIYG